MGTNKNKRATVYSVAYSALLDTTVSHFFGQDTMMVDGHWKKIVSDKVEFSEKPVAGGYEVDLKIKIADTSLASQQSLHAISQQYVVCRLSFSDDVDRILGTTDCPVVFTLERRDSPSCFLLHYKGRQPEMCKVLQSF